MTGTQSSLEFRLMALHMHLVPLELHWIGIRDLHSDDPQAEGHYVEKREECAKSIKFIVDALAEAVVEYDAESS